MRIGVFQPQHDTASVKIYTDNILHFLRKQGIEISFFTKHDAVSDVDLVWDPTCTGARYPNRKLLKSSIPWVVTLHGAAILSTPLAYNFNSFTEKIKGLYTAIRRRIAWSIYKHKVAHIITVSEYAKQELIQYLHFAPENISVVYHGYDTRLFYPSDKSRNYLLHISMYQPKKNVDRIIEAYQLIDDTEKLPLVVVCPGYNKQISDSKITIISEQLNAEQVATQLRGAYAFVFPSLHESFGMPLVEAMACGTPILSSNTTACPEIIGDAGLLVNPLSVDDICSVMTAIMTNKETQQQLAKEALHRAKNFSWEKSAQQHELIFRSVCSKTNVN